jgi:hypothetical protein
VNNENEESHSGPDHADSGTEHSVRHEAEAQHEEEGRSGKAETNAGASCLSESGA